MKTITVSSPSGKLGKEPFRFAFSHSARCPEWFCGPSLVSCSLVTFEVIPNLSCHINSGVILSRVVVNKAKSGGIKSGMKSG